MSVFHARLPTIGLPQRHASARGPHRSALIQELLAVIAGLFVDVTPRRALGVHPHLARDLGLR